MDEIAAWLEKQIEINDPSRAGAGGAVRMAEAALGLLGVGTAMAFGLALTTEPANAASLARRIKLRLDEWIAGLDAEAREDFRRSLGTERVQALGLALVAPPVTLACRVRLTYRAEVTRIHADGDESPVDDADRLRLFDGTRPSEGFADVGAAWPLCELEWLVGADIVVQFDEAASGLVACLTLDSSRSLTPDDLAELGRTISERLWESGWSLNLEWDTPSALPGFGPDDFASIFVSARAMSAEIVASAP